MKKLFAVVLFVTLLWETWLAFIGAFMVITGSWGKVLYLYAPHVIVVITGWIYLYNIGSQWAMEYQGGAFE